MDKVRSKYKETRCTCITDSAKGQSKKQYRPTEVDALSRNRFNLKSVVVRVENTWFKANATGRSRSDFKVRKRHHVASSRARAHRSTETEIKIEIKSRSRPTEVRVRFERSVAARKAGGGSSVATRKARGVVQLPPERQEEQFSCR